jgi:thiol-disulfide isomerase/thioredoxin
MKPSLVLACALWACSTPSAAPPSPPGPPTAIAPDALAALLGEAPGHPRLIHFWATWCAPCVAELPTLRQIGQQRRDVEIVMVNVDVPALHDRRVRPMIAQQHLDGLRHLLLDAADPDAALRARVPGWKSEIPFSLLVDDEGHVLQTWATPLSPQALAAALDAAAVTSPANPG